MEVVAVDAPEGLTVRSKIQLPDEIVIHLTADAAKLKPGDSDNLILGAMFKLDTPARNASKPARANRGATPMVVMPAMTFTIQQALTKP
jgi:hypothetical protein